MGDPFIDAIIGGRRIVRRLGSGAAGRVYEARNPKADDRIEAVKVVIDADHPQASPVPGVPDQHTLLRREFAVLRALDHPHAPSAYAVGRDEDFQGGLSWMALEHAGAETLQRLLADGALRWKRAARIGRALAAVLHAAHTLEEPCVHRDLKPSNVAIDGDRVTLLDFGIVRLLNQRTIRVPGTVHGTPGYMAPEILHDASPTVASDVYALGVLLYEMLTGANPFGAAELKDVCQNQLSLQPLPLEPPTPEVLSQLVLAMLEKAPERRPTTAGVVHTVLSRLLEPSAAPEPPVEPEVEVPPPSRRWPSSGLDFPKLVSKIERAVLKTKTLGHRGRAIFPELVEIEIGAPEAMYEHARLLVTGAELRHLDDALSRRLQNAVVGLEARDLPELRYEVTDALKLEIHATPRHLPPVELVVLDGECSGARLAMDGASLYRAGRGARHGDEGRNDLVLARDETEWISGQAFRAEPARGGAELSAVRKNVEYVSVWREDGGHDFLDAQASERLFVGRGDTIEIDGGEGRRLRIQVS